MEHGYCFRMSEGTFGRDLTSKKSCIPTQTYPDNTYLDLELRRRDDHEVRMLSDWDGFFRTFKQRYRAFRISSFHRHRSK